MPENNNNFQYVSSVDEVSSGHSKAFSITGERGKIEIALFNLGQFYAISNICVHKGGPLSKGALEGDIVTCPWHGWKYFIKNGKSPHKGGDSISSYPCGFLEDGHV